MISEGLGLEQGYFDKGLCEEGNLSVNHYPACPDPTLTWGAGEHNDPGLMTILHQDQVEGLQFFNNDGNWTLIEPNPNAFVVIVGSLLQVVSNGKLKSAKHRVVTNATKDRTTLGFFNEPKKDRTVGPAKALLSSGNPPICEPVQFGDLIKAVVAAFTGVKE
ncbi:hyoscyamine 6-dioxygenase-like [Silene latifolia]|uniref:hyoscyamine 6-dioxygenase-like n=1 Tax=Silene latifolia TaxID=37657 RepID=UPI003D77FE76